MPTWVRAILAAKYHEAPVWELLKQPDWEFWVEAGMLMRGIESDQAERRQKKS